MILVDDVQFYPYVILIDGDRVLGLDPRPIAALEAEWFERGQAFADRLRRIAHAGTRADIANEALARKKIEGDPILSGDGVGDGVDLREVAPPPVEVATTLEIFRLSGLPDGYGAVLLHAGQVRGIARAWGEEADDFCAGVPTRRIGGKPRARGKSKKARRS